MKLHASGEDYLETILVLQKKLGMFRSIQTGSWLILLLLFYTVKNAVRL